jgi:DNA-binding NarL/FixJ family response regulator
LVAAGWSNDVIASQLFLSPHTGKTHVNRAMTTLVGRDGAQLVVVVYGRRLVDPYR